jgi:hypothetical protein
VIPVDPRPAPMYSSTEIEYGPEPRDIMKAVRLIFDVALMHNGCIVLGGTISRRVGIPGGQDSGYRSPRRTARRGKRLFKW